MILGLGIFYDRAITIKKQEKQLWLKENTLWVLSLFGTAVGAGILFLPINAGLQGFWPVALMAVLISPVIYLAHRGLARFVLSGESENSDISDVACQHYGELAGFVVTLLYFLAIYPILLVYGIGATNTVESFVVNQLGWQAPNRLLLAAMVIILMMAVVLSKEAVMLVVIEWLVYPLVALLLLISVYLIPYWQLESIFYQPSLSQFAASLWLMLPVLIFSFNHSPAISSFVHSYRCHDEATAAVQVDRVLRITTVLLVFFIFFFVFSCILALSPDHLVIALQQNISILSYFANHLHSPLFTYVAPFIALMAIASSFFGHYLGAREGLHGLILHGCHELGVRPPQERVLEYGIVIFFFFTLLATAVSNPSILMLIEAFVGPIIALILFILPVVSVYRVPALARYQGGWANYYVFFFGLLAISAIIYRLLH